MDRLTITRPDDWHLHLRDGQAMASVLEDTVRRFGWKGPAYEISASPSQPPSKNTQAFNVAVRGWPRTPLSRCSAGLRAA